MEDIRIIRARQLYLGKIFKTKNSGDIVIIEYNSSKDVKIQFEDNTTMKVNIEVVRSGYVRNVFRKTIYGVGYFGVGKYNSKNSRVCYHKWAAMLERCYNEEYQKEKLTYIGCTVCEEWHNFQNFAEWFEHNYDHTTMKMWHLDKDILLIGNKIYSPTTCCFVPNEVNQIFSFKRTSKNTGVYQKNNKYYPHVSKKGGGNKYLGTFLTLDSAIIKYKEEKIKIVHEIAEKWKGKIDNRVYEKLINYKP